MDYRLYYDDDGRVVAYTVGTDVRSEKYISITPEQFSESRMDVLVLDGKIVRTERNTVSFVLQKNTEGFKTSKYDINIPTEEPDGNFWKITTHDRFSTGNIHH